MSDAGAGELVERLVQRDRIGRGERAIDLDRTRDDAEGAERRRLATRRRPNLPHKRRDRGLAAGSSDRDDGIWLARIEARRRPGQRGARVFDPDERRAERRRRAFAHDHRRAPGERIRYEGNAVLLRAGEGKESVAWLDLAAVGGQAADRLLRQGGRVGAEVEDLVETRHSLPTRSASPPNPRRARIGNGWSGKWSAGGTPSSGSTRSTRLPVVRPALWAAVW